MLIECSGAKPQCSFRTLRRLVMYIGTGLAVSTFATAYAHPSGSVPRPPAPEPISVSELPLPPTAPSTSAGACSTAINPNGTGCMSADSGAIQSGSFLPGNHEILVLLRHNS